MGVLTQSAQEGFNYQKVIKASDLTEAVSATEQVIDCFDLWIFSKDVSEFLLKFTDKCFSIKVPHGLIL